MNNDIPASKTQPRFYVGIGASAGGLEAIEQFFGSMPTDSGFTFIIIQHLSPDHKSHMVEILSKKTAMRVLQAETGTTVEANTIYLIPPKTNLTIFHGRLIATEQDRSLGISLPIDVFLRSLAEDQAERSVAVILSGTGSDGMRGSRAVKEAGGMVMVQAPDSAKFDGMPRSTIATGTADVVASPEELPQQLMLVGSEPTPARDRMLGRILTDEDSLTRIYALLRERNKVDFTFYKPATIVRRIQRRMQLNQIQEIGEYAALLARQGTEVNALYKELLIGVTNFFRDPKVFDLLLEKYLPDLLRNATGPELRFWVAGCSSGEEAYSLAIISREVISRLNLKVECKIFATDIDGDTVARAGSGVYPESIAADIAPALLQKYFYHQGSNYHVSRAIREQVVFAQHNLVKDPPFTKIDLVSCRNLLIYFMPVLQHKVMEYFNFSLNPGGLLVLGSSETVGEMGDFFQPLENKWKIYRSRGRRHRPELHMTDGERLARMAPGESPPRFQRQNKLELVCQRLSEALVGHYFALALVVTAEGRLLHVVGDSRNYLNVPSGMVSHDISRMADRSISVPLTTGLQKVFRDGKQVLYTSIPLASAERPGKIAMRILHLPGKGGNEDLALVLIEEEAGHHEPSPGIASDVLHYDAGQEARQRIGDLEQELQFTRENLQATVEELETSNEELQATNEELLASNEELQATNEELQSVNEELFTVNSEYQQKIMELTETTNDMDNLLTATGIATLFLDESLRIRRFSPGMTDFFHCIPEDVGRPITDLRHRFAWEDPAADLAVVQRSGQAMEKTTMVEGLPFLLRIMPYRISPDRISGAVATFIGLTPRPETAPPAPHVSGKIP